MFLSLGFLPLAFSYVTGFSQCACVFLHLASMHAFIVLFFSLCLALCFVHIVCICHLCTGNGKNFLPFGLWVINLLILVFASGVLWSSSPLCKSSLCLLIGPAIVVIITIICVSAPHTLQPKDYYPVDNDFISNYNLKPLWQIFLTDSNVNLICDNDFLYWFFSAIMTWEWAKAIIFPYLYWSWWPYCLWYLPQSHKYYLLF